MQSLKIKTYPNYNSAQIVSLCLLAAKPINPIVEKRPGGICKELLL
jgi:hypothetical protein